MIPSFLVIQHAPLHHQIKYLPIVKKAVDTKKAKVSDYAMLVDRINMYEGKFQIYGTQLNYDNGAQIHIYPIYQEPHVDKRRRLVGLSPMQEYIKMVDPNFRYTVPDIDVYKNKVVIKGSTIEKESNSPLEKVSILKNDNSFLGN